MGVGAGSMRRQQEQQQQQPPHSPAPSGGRRLSRSGRPQQGRPRQRGASISPAAPGGPGTPAPSPAAAAAAAANAKAAAAVAAAASASAAGHAGAVTSAAPSAAAAPPGTLRRGRSLDVICEEVLGEAPQLTNPVRRRRSELIPRARLIPRRAASETRASSRCLPPLEDAEPRPGPPGVRRCQSVRSEEGGGRGGGVWGASYWRPASAAAARRSNSLCCSPVTRTPSSYGPAAHGPGAPRRSQSVREHYAPDGLHSSSQRCSRSNSYRCPAPSPFRDPVKTDEEEQQPPAESQASAAAAAAAAAAVAAAAVGSAAMTRRPQVLRVTDSATTSSTSRRQLSQPAAVSPPLVSPPLSPSPEASPQPADSPLGSPRPSSPGSPASEHHRTFVSQSSVTLRGVPVYDEYLCADHRWVRPVAPLRPRSESTTSTTAESEEDSAGTGATAGSSSSSCGSSYVTWTKSSLRSKQWQMLHSPSASGRRGAEAPAQPAASRILKDELVETGGEEGCVAVLAPCPGPAAPASPAVSLLTLAPKSDGRPPPARTRSDAQRHQRHHSEFDGLLQYLQDYRHGLRELLVNNNVVIIEPVRASQAKRHSAELRDDRRAHSAPGEDHRGDKACRITGAIVKSPEKDSGTGTHTAHAGRGSNSNNTLPRSQKPHQPILRRQFFYQDLLLKINKELVDAELPDPDTVRNARKVFERAAPLGVGKAGLGLSGLSGLSHSHSGLDKRMCWTDSGSLSSGVSSDLSCCDLSCDTDHHHLRSLRSLRSTGTCSSGSLSLSQQEVFSSGDESEADQPHPKAPRTAAAAPPPPVPAEAAALSADGNPVSEDVLQKIRACGTTVTYFGGQVIACSGAGPVRSPMTMAIMEEIRRSARPIMLGGSLGVSLGASLGASLGIKFRLVKSNSCGSRLELAGQTVGGGGRWPRPARSHAAPTTPAASMASTASTTSTASAASTTSTASAATPAPTPTEAPAPAVNFPMANRNRQVEEQVVSVDIGDSLTDSLSSEDARNSSTTTASSCGAGEGVNTSPHDESPTVDVKEFVNARNAELRKSDARNGPVRNGDLRKTEVKRNGGSEDKENRPVVGITSWKMNGKDIKTLEDLRRPSVPPIPLPAVPQQQDKFGTMEFEEFQFIE